MAIYHATALEMDPDPLPHRTYTSSEFPLTSWGVPSIIVPLLPGRLARFSPMVTKIMHVSSACSKCEAKVHK
ncbi:unnamed protein product [Hermetia illucens]|uniref:Uncharacterized protein n=1 Tax=Hermetia illucens TaxID=343691 RepID=A0A7R8Z193_HERIL|nr:unnamed protein product [Hermetia illucens]